MQKTHKEVKSKQYAIRLTDSLNNSILKLCKDSKVKRSDFIHSALETAIERS